MLAHVAEAMGIVAAETIAGVETMAIDFRFIPRATYCQPQIGSMGLSEAQAREAGHDVKTATFPFSANGKAMGLGEPCRFRQGHRRRRAQRDPRRRPHRPRRHRAAAGPQPRADVGPHGRRGLAHGLRAPDARRGRQGSRPRHRRPHDQLLRARSRMPSGRPRLAGLAAALLGSVLLAGCTGDGGSPVTSGSGVDRGGHGASCTPTATPATAAGRVAVWREQPCARGGFDDDPDPGGCGVHHPERPGQPGPGARAAAVARCERDRLRWPSRSGPAPGWPAARAPCPRHPTATSASRGPVWTPRTSPGPRAPTASSRVAPTHVSRRRPTPPRARRH